MDILIQYLTKFVRLLKKHIYHVIALFDLKDCHLHNIFHHVHSNYLQPTVEGYGI